jgi:hypothetical protein
MASGDLTASTPVYCEGSAAVKTAIDALNLAAVTDFLFVLPVEGKTNVWIVFKVEREA